MSEPTLLTPCRVPWMISPSMSAVTLTHSETDTEPECSVVFAAGRMTDTRRIEIRFEMCSHARACPLNGGGVERIYPVEPSYDGPMSDYLTWLRGEWKATGFCPSPGFYVATKSEWLSSLSGMQDAGYHHYVVVGRDGYVELIAERYRWREWMWTTGHREDLAALGDVVASGEGA